MNRQYWFSILMGLVLASCAAAPADIASAASSSLAAGQGRGSGSDQDSHALPLKKSWDGEVSEDEIAGITFMREEEKLARDVYLQLADIWGMNIFSNIASSEQTHSEAVGKLLSNYHLVDPAAGLDQGEFQNPDLQELYHTLIARGSESLEEALLVGAAIEEIDILDLQEYLSATANQNLVAVYRNLLRGSVNHLNAFVRMYEARTGEEYSPQYLSETAFQELLAEAGSFGGNGGKGQGGQPRGRGQSR